MLKQTQIVFLIGFAVIFATLTAQAEMYRGYEMPPYAVEKQDGAFEVRTYRSHLQAEVTVEGNRGNAISAGFRVLANFIFGANASVVADPGPDGIAPSEKIEMTVPVSQLPTQDGWTVRFMMPAEYSLETLPKPDNKAIRFVETDPERQVVVRFKGLWNDAKLDQYEAELRDWAAARGLSVTGDARYYFYDGPMTLPWNRRNEVALPIG